MPTQYKNGNREGGQEGRDTGMCMADSCCWTAEANTALKQLYAAKKMEVQRNP